MSACHPSKAVDRIRDGQFWRIIDLQMYLIAFAVTAALAAN